MYLHMYNKYQAELNVEPSAPEQSAILSYFWT